VRHGGKRGADAREDRFFCQRDKRPVGVVNDRFIGKFLEPRAGEIGLGRIDAKCEIILGLEVAYRGSAARGSISMG